MRGLSTIIACLLILTEGLGQNGSRFIDGTLQVTEQTGTMTELVGQSPTGFFGHITVGTGLELTSGTLKTVGGGLVFADVEPVSLVGVNSISDTLTNIWMTSFDEPGPGGSVFEVNNIRLQRDTLYALRGSFFQGFESAQWAKTLDSGVVDTLNIDSQKLFDFSETGGRYTYEQPEQYSTPLATDFDWSHIFRVTSRIDIRTTTAGDIELLVYVNGVEDPACTVEYFLGGSNRTATISTTCLMEIYDTDVIDVRLKNTSGGSVTYNIERATFNANHIKSRSQPPF